MKAKTAGILFIRLLTALALGVFLYRACHQWLITPTLTLTLVIAGELITLTIYLSARASKEDGFGTIAVISTLVGTFFFYFVILRPGPALVPLYVTASMQVIGIVWQIVSKLSLGRSFGLLPANRGIVTRGTYRLVRHPIYLGYLVNYAGFVLASFSWYNLSLIAAQMFFQILRIMEEERVLKRDPSYQAYMAQTRYRLLPGVF